MVSALCGESQKGPRFEIEHEIATSEQFSIITAIGVVVAVWIEIVERILTIFGLFEMEQWLDVLWSSSSAFESTTFATASWCNGRGSESQWNVAAR